MIKIYDKFKGIGRYRKLSDKVKQFISSDEFPKTIKLSKKVKELIYIDKLRDSHGGTGLYDYVLIYRPSLSQKRDNYIYLSIDQLEFITGYSE